MVPYPIRPAVARDGSWCQGMPGICSDHQDHLPCRRAAGRGLPFWRSRDFRTSLQDFCLFFFLRYCSFWESKDGTTPFDTEGSGRPAMTADGELSDFRLLFTLDYGGFLPVREKVFFFTLPCVFWGWCRPAVLSKGIEGSASLSRNRSGLHYSPCPLVLVGRRLGMGPRFLLVITPYLILPAGIFFGSWSVKSRSSRG